MVALLTPPRGRSKQTLRGTYPASCCFSESRAHPTYYNICACLFVPQMRGGTRTDTDRVEKRIGHGDCVQGLSVLSFSMEPFPSVTTELTAQAYLANITPSSNIPSLAVTLSIPHLTPSPSPHLAPPPPLLNLRAVGRSRNCKQT